MNESNNVWPAFLPDGSVTFKELFFPFLSTMIPLLKVTFNKGGIVEPSLTALLGLFLSPPNAQAILSNTEVYLDCYPHQ